MTRGVKYIVQGTGATAPVSYWRERNRVMANARAYAAAHQLAALRRALRSQMAGVSVRYSPVHSPSLFVP